MTFHELQLLPQLLRAVDDLGYAMPSPIQAASIPVVVKGGDLIGCAQTGTGKTAAFAIPILQQLHSRVNKRHTPIRALVLTPTRELALQIKESFDQYGKYLDIRNTVIFGGVGQAPQVEALQKGVDVLVATPGRLNDLCGQGHICLEGVETFVLDEADRMLDMGFIHDVRKVIARLPEKRQTLLFSATMPQEIAELSRKILHNPARVEVTPQSSTVDAIEQRLYKVDKGNKKFLLQHVLQDESLDSVLVFTNTKHGADRVVKELGRAGIAAMAIHGNKGQTARIRALDSFKSGAIRVLVATDIAARGIDVNELAAVVNYELPNVPETYVHRIGRTGRAGRDGVAISFCNFDELAYLRDIEKLTRKKVPVVEGHPWPMEILEPTPKKQREPRPPRSERQPKGRQSAPKEERPAAVRVEKPAFRPESRPERVRASKPARPAEPAPPPPVSVPEPPKAAVRRISSEPPRVGRLVAFADGRRRRRKK
ncbi:MAG: DEAD/DEAH box helicase [Oscillospiraceae bacterium]|jgi:ATP-dependent RNA helicase RhlE|nr:DEAD/DEAH box helicase [Oscillospiraceae bacterium]MCI8714671.1 DEAD/DEAH box helicase [Oscillospiraceae bacterium]